MLLEAETNKYCPGGNDIGAISNLITWVLNFFFECAGTDEFWAFGPVWRPCGARVLLAPVFLGPLPHKTGRCAPPPPPPAHRSLAAPQAPWAAYLCNSMGCLRLRSYTTDIQSQHD